MHELLLNVVALVYERVKEMSRVENFCFLFYEGFDYHFLGVIHL